MTDVLTPSDFLPNPGEVFALAPAARWEALADATPDPSDDEGSVRSAASAIYSPSTVQLSSPAITRLLQRGSTAPAGATAAAVVSPGGAASPLALQSPLPAGGGAGGGGSAFNSPRVRLPPALAAAVAGGASEAGSVGSSFGGGGGGGDGSGDDLSLSDWEDDDGGGGEKDVLLRAPYGGGGGGGDGDSDADSVSALLEEQEAAAEREEEAFWGAMEAAAGVRGDVRARAVEARRLRLLRVADDAEEDLERHSRRERGALRDYVEGALLLAAWCGIVAAMVLWSGYHAHIYMVLRPLAAMLVLPAMLTLTLFWLESGRRGARARAALAKRARALRRRAARALTAAT